MTGLIDQVVDTDEEALDAIKKFLSYMPAHCNEAPPVLAVPAGSGEAMADIVNLLPPKRTQVYDVRKIIKTIVDRDSYFELKPRFGKVAVTALARINGRSVGIIANNPLFKGGALDADGCDKATSLTVMCDSFNIPIIMFVDTPGFIIGLDAERKRAPGKIVNFMGALSLVTVPKLTIVLRKSYGQAYLNMGGGATPTSFRPGPRLKSVSWIRISPPASYTDSILETPATRKPLPKWRAAIASGTLHRSTRCNRLSCRARRATT